MVRGEGEEGRGVSGGEKAKTIEHTGKRKRNAPDPYASSVTTARVLAARSHTSFNKESLELKLPALSKG